ncbi:hypothetical protein Esti_006515 [Eimeria stiedai]
MAFVRPEVTDMDPDSEMHQDALAQGAIACARLQSCYINLGRPDGQREVHLFHFPQKLVQQMYDEACEEKYDFPTDGSSIKGKHSDKLAACPVRAGVVVGERETAWKGLEVRDWHRLQFGGPAVFLMRKKDRRDFVVLECTEARAVGKTPSRYTTTKNRKNTPELLQLRKYNKFLRRRTMHKELK